MENPHRNISDTLGDIMRERHISAEKLADATDIPKRFIVSLMDGDPEQLPARPYVRGYLFKIAEALEVDPHTLWQSYRISTEISASGDKDKLPSNRFAYKKIATSRVAAVLLLLVAVAFVGFRFNEILGRPTLEVSVPDTTTEETITVSGKVAPGDRLTLNDEVVYPNEEGYFEKRVQLEPNLNTLTFTVKRYLGKETTLVKRVFYQPPSTSQ